MVTVTVTVTMAESGLPEEGRRYSNGSLRQVDPWLCDDRNFHSGACEDRAICCGPEGHITFILGLWDT